MSQPQLVGPMGDISSDRHTAQPARPRLFLISGLAFWSVSEPAGLSAVQNCPVSPSPQDAQDPAEAVEQARGRGWMARFLPPTPGLYMGQSS